MSPLVLILRISLLKAASVSTLRYIITAIRDEFQIVTFRPSVSMVTMCSPMNTVLRTVSIANFLILVNNTDVRKSPVWIRSVMMPWFLSRSVDAEESNRSTSSNILGNQAVRKPSFKIIFCWDPV